MAASAHGDTEGWRRWHTLRSGAYEVALATRRGHWGLVYELDPTFAGPCLANARRLQAETHPQVAPIVQVDPGSPDTVVTRFFAGPTLAELVGRWRNTPAAVSVPRAVALVAGAAEAYGWVTAQLGAPLGSIDGTEVRVGADGQVRVHTPGPSGAERAVVLGRPSWVSTVRLMARERVTREAFGPSTDVYSLAALLYELIFGHPVLPGAGDMDRVMALVRSVPAQLEPREGVPPGLVSLLQAALDHNPAARPADLPTFAAALRPFAEDGAVAALTPTERAAASITTQDRDLAPSARAELWAALKPSLVQAVWRGRVEPCDAVVLIALAPEARDALRAVRADPTAARGDFGLVDALCEGAAVPMSRVRRVRLGAVEVEVCGEAWDTMHDAGSRNGMEARHCTRCREVVVRVDGFEDGVLAVGHHCTRFEG